MQANNAPEQVKDRLSVVDVVGEYLKLEKAGANYKALCPFHNENTPSFMVNPDRDFWYCFGCQKGGDIFSFLMDIEGVDFREALERLADRAGIELPRFDPTVVKKRSEKEKLVEIIELAAKAYQQKLKNDIQDESLAVKKYLASRDVGEPLIDEFRIGLAPEGWDNILKYLRKKGYTDQEIEKTGLVVKRSDSIGAEGFYDRFRERIMFPILDINGKVVGFSARIVPGGDEKSAKYINTPETEVYNKSSILYGLYQAKAAIRLQDYILLVEGNLDVIASHFAGVKNVVAISGTALTSKQTKILKRYTHNAKLCFDMDDAGQRATEKSIQMLLQEGFDVEVILLPKEHKDVSDLVSENKKKWVQLSEKGVPVMEYFFNKNIASYDEKDVRSKKLVAKNLLNKIKDIADPIEQSYWLKKLSSSIDVDEEMLTNVLEKSSLGKELKKGGSGTDENESKVSTEEKKTRRKILEERLLGLFALFPGELSKKASSFEHEFLEQHQEIWQNLLEKKEFFSLLLEKYTMETKYIRDESRGLIENEIDPIKEWEITVAELEKVSRENRLKTLKRDIDRAKEEGDEQAEDLLLRELSKLVTEK